MLLDLPAPRLRAYSRKSDIADKVRSMVSNGYAAV
jgi:hypothetical protein